MPREIQGGSRQAAVDSVRESRPDALLPFIAESPFANSILESIQTDGYAVIPSVFSSDEADAALDRMWRYVECVSPGVRRENPNSIRPCGSGPDPWPHAQRDMMQLHQAGWVFTDLKETFAERVFEPLYGTRELHCSKDGFTFQRPTWGDLDRSPNDHFDQGSTMTGLQCIQGSVALTDQEFDDGCFFVWPGSHLLREEILATLPKKKTVQDFNIIGDRGAEMLEERGISPKRVPVNRGDVVLWRSDVCHKGAPPRGSRDNYRAVVYVCCLPAACTPEAVYVEKRKAYEQLKTGSHWPCREEWFQLSERHRRQAVGFRPFFRQPPQLSRRQEQLFGICRYVADEFPRELQHRVVPPQKDAGPQEEQEPKPRDSQQRSRGRWRRNAP